MVDAVRARPVAATDERSLRGRRAAATLLVCAAAASLVGAAATPGRAQLRDPDGTPPSAGRGAWIGSVANPAPPPRGQKVLVEFEMPRRDLGSRGLLHFGGPLHCQLEAEVSDLRQSGAFTVSLEASTGGKCDRLEGGYATLRPSADGRGLDFRAMSKTDAPFSSGTLQAMP